MSIIKKVRMGVLLAAVALFTLPVYAQAQNAQPQTGIYLAVSPAVTYSVPASSPYCLKWIPQQVDANNNSIPAHYINVCYQLYPYPYYGYGYGYGSGLYGEGQYQQYRR